MYLLTWAASCSPRALASSSHHIVNAVVALTEDHKPNQERERKRIESEGGVVIWAGTWRVGGVLAVSRAFGDRPLKRYVIACPDVRHDNLDSGEESIILASDGLWDVVSNKVRLRLRSLPAQAQWLGCLASPLLIDSCSTCLAQATTTDPTMDRIPFEYLTLQSLAFGRDAAWKDAT